MKKTILSVLLMAIAMMAMADISGYNREILVWPNGAPDDPGFSTPEYISGTGWYNISVSKLYTYLPKSGTPKGTILVIPGGGYGTVGWSGEGAKAAQRFVNDGWAAVVLKYRLPNGHCDIPLEDACQSMQMLRDSATQFGLNPDGPFGVIGFSAGGHLASTLVTKFYNEKARPDFGILIYPVITLEAGKTHNGSRTNLLGSSPSMEKTLAWSTYTQVTSKTPPCLLALCQDDPTVPTISSVLMYNALCDSNIYADMVITPTGGHAWGADGTSLVQRDVVDDAVFKFIDSTILASSPVNPYVRSPKRLPAPTRVYLYGSGDGYVDVYAPKSYNKSIILSLLGTEEQVGRFVDDNYQVVVLHCRPSVSQADSLADVEQAMLIIRQMQEESAMDCAVGCMAKSANAPLAVKILTQTENDAVRPDFGILYSPNLKGLDITQMVSNSTPPCIIMSNQDEEEDVSLMTDFYMAMTNANRRECELVLTHQQSTIDMALTRFLEDKFFTKSSSMHSSVGAMADQLGWADNELPGTLQFNSILSLTNEKPLNQCKYIASKKGLRFYQQCGSYTIQAREGAIIKYIKLTYSSFDTNQKGVVIKDWGTDGYDYPDSAKIESGKTYMVNANSIKLWTGSLGPKVGTDNQGTVCITGFEIAYEDSTSVIESYMSLTKESSTDDVPFNGDGNIYDWKVKNYQRKASDNSDYVNNSLGIRLKYNSTTSEGYLTMNGAQEGGIKDISFDYHALNTTMPIHFFIKNGSTTLDEVSHAKVADVNNVYNYTKVLNIESNAELSIVMPKQETPQQTYITMGPLTITPYLLYETKMVTLKKEDMVEVAYKYTNADLINNTDGGSISYSVIGTNADKIASVDAATGEVTVIGEGVVKVQAKWGNVTTSYQLTITTKEPGFHHVACTVTELAKRYNWVNGNDNNCYNYFALNDIISVTASAGNAKYLNSVRETECLRFYQGSNKGLFTIRAKAGVIIQSIKLDYHQDGVVTTDYGTNGASIPAAKQVKSGVPYKVDGNYINLYVGSTDASTGKQVRIENFEVTYFIPETGATVTKSAFDLAKNYGLKNNTCYQDLVLNSAIAIHADKNNTLKYYTSGNFNCYRHTGPIEIKAREGAIIHYVKVSYTPTAADYVLTKNWGTNGCNIAAKDQIASDSILYVNGNSVKLYVGYTKSEVAWSGVAITKIYVNYSDKEEVIVENFDNCPVTNSTNMVEVSGMRAYDWQLTNFNRDSLRRIHYDQSIMLRPNGGKLATVSDEGGVKEVAFAWKASDKAKGVKFYVKAGGETVMVDSAAMGDYYSINFVKTGVRNNGAFSIEVDPASGSQLEVGQISITPYLLFRVREDSVDTDDTKSYDVSEVLIDNTEDAANISYSIESDETLGATISGSVVSLGGSVQNGDVVVKAAWENVATYITLHVTAEMPTDIDEVGSSKSINSSKYIVNGHLVIERNGQRYNVQGIKLNNQ